MGKEGKYDLKLAEAPLDIDTEDKEEDTDQPTGMFCCIERLWWFIVFILTSEWCLQH